MYPSSSPAPSRPAPPPPDPPGAGLAVAALVLGALGATFALATLAARVLATVALPLGVAAVTLGAVAVARARPARVPQGWVGAALGLVALAGGAAGLVAAADDIDEDVAPLRHDDAAGDITTTECGPDVLGDVARGELANPTADPVSYVITVAFTDGEGVRYAEAATLVNAVQPGQTATWEARPLAVSRPGSTCEVVDVQRRDT